MRLDKLLSNMGIGSRKEIRGILKQGAVTVDGKPVTAPETSVDPERQTVLFNGTEIRYRPYVYLMMNKPQGVISATEDSRGQPTVLDLIGSEYGAYSLSPAGRLDADTEGFLLLTNDGPFIHRIISPKKHVMKEYYARLDGSASEEDCRAAAAGIVLEDGTVCLPAEMEILSVQEASGQSEILLRICEGKFHQVKRMMQARGLKVRYLKRLAIGGLRLDARLQPGEYREITREEQEQLTEERNGGTQ